MRAMVEGAGRVVSLTTASKLGSAGPYPVAAIERIDTLVSDAPDEELQVYRDLGIEVRARMTGTPKQARAAVTAIFFLNGLVFGDWAARIPAVRDRVGLSDGELGIVLACAAIGSIVAMPIAGGRAARIGSRRATRVAFALMCLASGVIALAPSLPVLCALAFFYGASMGSLDVTMNAHGVAVERRYGRAILASFHAAFSIGGLAGGVIGALAAARRPRRPRAARARRRRLGRDRPDVVAALPGAPTRTRWAAPSRSSCARRGACWRSARWPSPACSSRARRPTGARSTCATSSAPPPAIAAIGFTAFSVTMTLGRIFGDRLVDRFGPEAVVRAGGGVAAVGFGLALAGRGARAGDRRLRVPGRRDVGRRADRLPRLGPRAGHGRRRRAGRGLEHRLPRLPRRPADHRRPRRALGLPDGARRARPPRRGRRAAGAAPRATRAPARPSSREPQTVAA